MNKNKKEILSTVLMGLCSLVHLGCANFIPSLTMESGLIMIIAYFNHEDILKKNFNEQLKRGNK